MEKSRTSLLTFIEFCGKTPDGHRVARFRCECGSETTTAFSRVKHGYTKSCGCLSKETKPNLIHGHRFSRTYSSWSSAKDRSTNPASKDFHRYGGAGIGMAERWLSFENFLSDMGERPKGTTLDRINGSRGYEPGNCRWASPTEQARNKKTSCIWHIKGFTFQSAREAAEHFGVSVQSVWRWVRGYHDSRRGTYSPPREDCYASKRY